MTYAEILSHTLASHTGTPAAEYQLMIAHGVATGLVDYKFFAQEVPDEEAPAKIYWLQMFADPGWRQEIDRVLRTTLSPAGSNPDGDLTGGDILAETMARITGKPANHYRFYVAGCVQRGRLSVEFVTQRFTREDAEGVIAYMAEHRMPAVLGLFAMAKGATPDGN